MRGDIPSLPQNALMAWYSVKSHGRYLTLSYLTLHILMLTSSSRVTHRYHKRGTGDRVIAVVTPWEVPQRGL
jgi:hypothetical protein